MELITTDPFARLCHWWASSRTGRTTDCEI